MPYYLDPQLEAIRNAVEREIRGGVRVLSASYIVNRYGADPVRVQRVLSDLVSAEDLTVHYRVLCSGENQRYDVDREFDNLSEIPKYPLVCTRCGDVYTPSEENISVFFEPTPVYLSYLQEAS